ncbi:hypothetical protein SAMN04490244_106290 [Tranquillimonas rosea]|uniref:Uncharacterized protein n=1 Tax=Tranquillimonas rosea TaxID=641238 RepID=A0A1H9V6T7_9RHOB|nr:glyceraldehyde-3-phosphate dehydrogenase [Tranquillimonas rosea]SES17392.1 hypothetical protein SAMN04490244_106290 [Tranquillimonas rosea]
MTNSIALGLGLTLAAALALTAWYAPDALIHLGREFTALVAWVAFWR